MSDLTPPTVINIKDAPAGWKNDPQYIWIGNEDKEEGLKASPWAHSYRISVRKSREENINEFDGRMIARLHLDGPKWMKAIKQLTGKTLVCRCKPNPCHGDVLVDLWYAAMGDKA